MKDASSGLKKDFVEAKALRDHFDKLAEEGKR